MALFFSNGEKPWRDFWHSLVKEHLSNYKVICVVNCDHTVESTEVHDETTVSITKGRMKDLCHRSNMELDLQSFFGLLCTTVLIGRDPATPPPPLRIWAHIRVRYWSAKIDDISW